ncbi:MAG: SpoIIE family protein phosphatase [Chloroflexi bacterium]|nr:SpoIIE family protein phosphatase [Chloroflexota bacterium]
MADDGGAIDRALAARRVLVVDDDPDINRLVSVRLKARGFDVRSASDGEEALAELVESPPDVLFLDVSMPGLSGLDVLERVRGERLDLAVIMMTAFGSEEVAVEALRRGADDYLRKPFETREFQAVLDRTVRRLELTRQNVWLQNQLDEKRRQLEEELARAARVQAELLPRDAPVLPGFELAARCLPAREVGGDFYDWLETAPGCVTLILGDVMGKGMPAALLMATVRAVLRAASQQSSPAGAVRIAAGAIAHDLDRSDSFVTLFHTQLVAAERRLLYVDAGHGYAFLRRSDGSVERLRRGGLPLGIMQEERYDEGCVDLRAGDTVVVYSDGLAEARADRTLDMPAVAQAVEGAATAAEMVDRLIALAGCAGECPDDLTVMVLRCRA